MIIENKNNKYNSKITCEGSIVSKIESNKVVALLKISA